MAGVEEFQLKMHWPIKSIRNKLVKFSAATVAFFLVLVGITGYYNDWLKHPYWNGGIYIKRPVRPLVEFVEREFKPGDIVGFTNILLMPPFSFYGRDRAAPPYAFFTFVKENAHSPLSIKTELFSFYKQGGRHPLYYFFDQEISDSNLKRPEIIDDFRVPVYRIGLLGAERIWIISSAWERDGSLDENSSLVNQWLANHFNLELHTKLEGVHIFRYGK